MKRVLFLAAIFLPGFIYANSVILSPGSSVQVQAGQTIDVTCSGSPASLGCTCEVYKVSGESYFAAKLKKSGATINVFDRYAYSELSAGRACFEAIPSEPLCK